MLSEGHQVASLHGSLDPSVRDATLDGFRDGKTKVLITTNVLARGIDIQQVNMVVNYDMPLDGRGVPDPETYLHRVGQYTIVLSPSLDLWFLLFLPFSCFLLSAPSYLLNLKPDTSYVYIHRPPSLPSFLPYFRSPSPALEQIQVEPVDSVAKESPSPSCTTKSRGRR